MLQAAAQLDFEKAAKLRDKIKRIEGRRNDRQGAKR